MSTLRAGIYVAPPIPFKKPDGKHGGFWSPISCTLIHGDKEAVLVNTPITDAQTKDLADWIENILQGRRRLTNDLCHPRTWRSLFPGEIDENFQLAKPLPASNRIVLEGHGLHVLEVGQADTHDSTILWVPDIKLAVCGDVVYGDVHQMLGEVNTKEKRAGWIASIRKVEALKPEIVVAGHKRVSEIDGAFHLTGTRKYIETFEGFLEGRAKDARELSKLMLERYPTRYNPGALIMGCMNAFKEASNKL